VPQQYLKYVGRPVEVKTLEGEKLEGVLLEAGNDKFVLETSAKERLEGQKKKQLVVKQHHLKYDEIKGAKAVISFK
jgi:ribosome maturation factor RimP